MHILAIDMGKNKSVFCDYDRQTAEHGFGTVSTVRHEFTRLIEQRRPDVVVIEIGPQAGWVVDLCQAQQVAVRVINTADEAWRWKNVKDKSDRKDALKLARFEAHEQPQYVHMPLPQVRQWRELIACRQDQQDQVTAVKNRLRAILDRRGEKWPAGKKGWTAAAVAELRSMGKQPADCGPEELWRGMLHVEVLNLEHGIGALKLVEAKLDQLADASPRVQRLKTTPGVGNRTAEMVVALIDDPHRFDNARQVGCYAGLTPRRRQSGQMDLQCHISHAGSGLLRKMLVQASWIGVRVNPRIREVYERVRRGSKTRRKTAIVAAARRLLTWLWAMDRDQVPWNGPPMRSTRRQRDGQGRAAPAGALPQTPPTPSRSPRLQTPARDAAAL